MTISLLKFTPGSVVETFPNVEEVCGVKIERVDIGTVLDVGSHPDYGTVLLIREVGGFVTVWKHGWVRALYDPAAFWDTSYRETEAY